MNWAWYRYCDCSHNKNMHRSGECAVRYPFAEAFPKGTIKYPSGTVFCACSKFQLDNLKYLEQLYKKKVKNGR